MDYDGKEWECQWLFVFRRRNLFVIDLLMNFELKKIMAAPKGHSGYGGGAPKGHPHYGGGHPNPRMTQEVFEQICERMIDGESANKVVKDLGIYWRDIADFRAKSEENERRYRYAREQLQEWHEQEIKIIADEPPRLIEKENGISYVDSAWVNLQRLRIDTRKWMMERLAPRTYSEKREDVGALALAGAIAGAGMMLSKMEDKLLGVRPGLESGSIIDQAAITVDEK